MDAPAPDDAKGRARQLDEVAAAATGAEEEAQVAGWWCKASPGLPFRRCGAALPPLGAAAGGDGDVDQVAGWYAERGARLIVQVSEADPAWRDLDGLLAARGLDVEAPVHVLAGALPASSAPPNAAGTPGDGALVAARIDAAWAARHAHLVGADERQLARADAYGRILASHGARALGASLRRGGQVVGIGFAVVDRGWVGIFGMATAPEWRRRGVATEVLAGLLAGGRRQGAEAAYLQVEVGNAPALALYERFGMARSHGYHYRSAATPAPRG